MNLEIWFKRPRTFHKEVTVSKTDLVDRRVTTITEDKLLDSNLLIPVSPLIHGEGLQYLVAKAPKNCLAVANILITGLREAKQKNVVTVSISELCQKVDLSKPTVIVAIDNLCELGYLSRVGKQSYYISPKLAWFGNQVDWAVALKELKDLITGEQQ
jgi:hypothetical protein